MCDKISHMKQQRLDGLADGIFAIVMTLLVIELRVPKFTGKVDDLTLWTEFMKLGPVFLSLIISFALLFTYWRAHHFITSVYAKNLTVGLANINALFFFLIALVPFTAHLLGEYPSSHTSITIYGTHIIAIGIVLYFMRRHVEMSPKIETAIITKADRRSGYIRILFPVFAASVAILFGYVNPIVSTVLFAAAILFNLLPASSNLIHAWLDVVFADDSDIIMSNHEKDVSLIKTVRSKPITRKKAPSKKVKILEVTKRVKNENEGEE